MKAWGSIPPDPCTSCSDCKSNLALSPEYHVEPLEHDFRHTLVDTDEGIKSLTRCIWCGRSKKEIEE